MLMIASTAGAASLGRLAVLSAIGEPLRAEIELSLAAEDLESATPRFASPEAYAAAGLQYNAALNGARLAIQYRNNGRRVIALVSTRPVTEPSLPLLVELNVRGGRIARAYNVLLGPAGDTPVSVAAPAPVAAFVAAAPAEKPLPVVRRATEAKSAVAAPPAKAAARVDDAAYDRELNRLATQLNAGDKVIKDMLSRVTVMEGQVAQLQKAFAALPTPDAGKAVSDKPVVEKAVVEKAPAEKPAAGPAPVIADPTNPVVPLAAPVMQEVRDQTATRVDTVPRNPHNSDRLLNLALLVLACGALALFIGLGYLLLGRRRAAKIAEAEAAIAAEAQNAA
ncbi:MAG: type IV pilus assembly protein FimV [Burkholderiales bacterium]